LRETQRKLDRERSMKTSLENRRKSFEKEKAELIRSVPVWLELSCWRCTSYIINKVTATVTSFSIYRNQYW